MSGVEHKIVLVTGGSGGLGRALAEAFVKHGCAVVITARNPARLQGAIATVARSGVEVLAVSCDICRRDQVRSVNEQITACWGAVQIPTNGACIARAESFMDMADAVWETLSKPI